MPLVDGTVKCGHRQRFLDETVISKREMCLFLMPEDHGHSGLIFGFIHCAQRFLQIFQIYRVLYYVLYIMRYSKSLQFYYLD